MGHPALLPFQCPGEIQNPASPRSRCRQARPVQGEASGRPVHGPGRGLLARGDQAEKTGSFDGFVFVTPEYNHSTSGVLKNGPDPFPGPAPEPPATPVRLRGLAARPARQPAGGQLPVDRTVLMIFLIWASVSAFGTPWSA
ncbi:NAD(P)H-dependent oxidoreductase [Streptomyces sp. PRh5]|uniref:NADPH-dependent FMN reductase n=1 Tax=Streptomyces sp. PRh5 TaxID=1158056 RepID=UPI001F5262AC|nr:NAD(P)H-dependent oxidoreductase [Streptomyces sp. PRh5]